MTDNTRYINDLGDDESSEEHLPLPAAVAERYAIRESIGQGGFGIVYLADDQHIGRDIAIKLLFAKWSENEKVDARFVQEARIAGQLEHPNIVIVYDLQRHPEGSCIIMEYIRGGNLRDCLRVAGRLPLDRSVSIVTDILHGLEAAHELGVVHRDIKPANILFGVRGEAKISDFGIAHLPSERGGLLSDDDRHQRLGSPYYVAPEQWRGRDVDQRTDLYAVGVILYEMLSGERAHRLPENSSALEVVKALGKNRPQPLGELCPELPVAVADVVMNLLARDPEDRIETAAQARLALGVAAGVFAGQGTGDLHTATSSSVDAEPKISDVIRLLLIDGVMAPAERIELYRRAEDLGVSRERAHQLELQVRQAMNIPTTDNADVDSMDATQGSDDGYAATQRLDDLFGNASG